MILAFLRLFPQFAAIEAELRGAVAAQVRAEDDARLWCSLCKSAEAFCDKALTEKEYNHKMICNWMALYYGSPSVPYPEVFVHIKREEPEAEPQPKKRHASDLARELDREFHETFGKQADREYDAFNQS